MIREKDSGKGARKMKAASKSPISANLQLSA